MEYLTTNPISLKIFLNQICQKYNIGDSSINENNHLNKHQNAYKIFNYKSINNQFNIDIKAFIKWQNTRKELCLEFFDNNFRNYFQIYGNDPSLEFYKLKK